MPIGRDGIARRRNDGQQLPSSAPATSAALCAVLERHLKVCSRCDRLQPCPELDALCERLDRLLEREPRTLV